MTNRAAWATRSPSAAARASSFAARTPFAASTENVSARDEAANPSWSRARVPATQAAGSPVPTVAEAFPRPPAAEGRRAGGLPQLHRRDELQPSVPHVLRRRAEQDVPRDAPLDAFTDHPEEDRLRLREVPVTGCEEERASEVRDLSVHKRGGPRGLRRLLLGRREHDGLQRRERMEPRLEEREQVRRRREGREAHRRTPNPDVVVERGTPGGGPDHVDRRRTGLEGTHRAVARAIRLGCPHGRRDVCQERWRFGHPARRIEGGLEIVAASGRMRPHRPYATVKSLHLVRREGPRGHSTRVLAEGGRGGDERRTAYRPGPDLGLHRSEERR